MTSFGFFLSCEEYGPRELVRQARMAEDAGFERLWISDHFHPWTDAQGQSPFVWNVIGALSEAVSLPVTTAVTCPTVRIHPAIVAQAAATSAVQLQNRFVLGLGSGEALNEHVLGDPWPSIGVRLEMLEEAIDVIRLLHTGREVSHHGKHYEVQDARIHTLPDQPVPIYVSGFGPQATDLAARIADGFCTVAPDAENIGRYREAGGRGPVQAGMKACWAETQDEGVATGLATWPNDMLGGQLAQILPRPRDFEAAAAPLRHEDAAAQFPAGPDPEPYVTVARTYLDAGVDELYVSQIGGHHEEFFRMWSEKVLPQLR